MKELKSFWNTERIPVTIPVRQRAGGLMKKENGRVSELEVIKETSGKRKMHDGN